MEAIIKNGVINNGVQSCFVSGCGIEVIFHTNELADKFATSLIPFGISYTKHENKVTIPLH